MDTIYFVCTASFLAVGLYWFVSKLGATGGNAKRLIIEIDRKRFQDNYNKYLSFFHTPKEIEKLEQVPDSVNNFYNLVTDIYEFGWGQSFHFAPSIPGKSKLECITIHEEMVVDLIDIKPSQKILDVGCGVGGPMRSIAAHSGCNVVGITINEYQVNRAKYHNKKAGLDIQCELVCGNFLEMPFEEDSFEGAYSIEATCHAPRLEDVYSEIFKVLKPGSMFVSYEWVTTDLYRVEEPEHVNIVEGIERTNALPGLRRYFDVVEAAKNVGFEVLTHKDLAKPPAKPWWVILKKGKQAFWSNQNVRRVGMVLKTLGIVPNGVVDVYEMLVSSSDFIYKGAETGIFTPMYMILCRKPE